jgi:hypothetical protein
MLIDCYYLVNTFHSDVFQLLFLIVQPHKLLKWEFIPAKQSLYQLLTPRFTGVNLLILSFE